MLDPPKLRAKCDADYSNNQIGTWFQHVHGQWAVITYIYVLETNTGATIRTGGLRFVGTVCGALYAFMVCNINSIDLALELNNLVSFRRIRYAHKIHSQ
jgi:hypothetical protein